MFDLLFSANLRVLIKLIEHRLIGLSKRAETRWVKANRQQSPVRLFSKLVLLRFQGGLNCNLEIYSVYHVNKCERA